MDKFRWCFIGAGRLANGVAQQISETGRHDIVSVYARRPEQTEEFAKKWGAEAASCAREAIDRPDVDGVYVVTPHSVHFEYAKLALELGKPVLVEKAFTMTKGQAEELFDLAESKGLYIAEAMWTWFSPVAYQVKTWLDEGVFGTLKEITFHYHGELRGYAPRLVLPELAGGALLDIGVYPITYIYRLFGKPERIVCEGELADGIDHWEKVHMLYEDGREFIADASMVDPSGEYMTIAGDRARLHVPGFHSARALRLELCDGGTIEFEGPCDMKQEFNTVADEIRAGRITSEFVPKKATLDVMEIMDECRAQLGLVYPFEQ